MSDADRCVVCGEVIPEGRQVCPRCILVIKEKENKSDVDEPPSKP